MRAIRKAFVGLLMMTAICGGFLMPVSVPTASAQELVQDTHTTVKAKVLEVLSQERKIVPGTDVSSVYQSIRVEVLSGKEKGKILTIENDYLELEKGDVFYLLHTRNELDKRDIYAVSEPYRMPIVVGSIILFLLAVLVFGGLPGVRGLVSLFGSFLLILYVLFPAILNGFSPVLATLGVASLIIVLGSYITHGFNRTTSAAVIGMIITVAFTGLLAHLAVSWGQLTGFSADEAVYLNFDTRGTIDFAGLLLGGILIGLLGVLYDAAIGQAISVEELRRAGPHLSKKFIYSRALRIGREHIGALVNTLAIAYIGASLPLLLLFYSSASGDLVMMVNKEIFSAEIIRAMVGSIGLVLAVPITTLVAVAMLMPKSSERESVSEADLAKEKAEAEHFSGHGHSH